MAWLLLLLLLLGPACILAQTGEVMPRIFSEFDDSKEQRLHTVSQALSSLEVAQNLCLQHIQMQIAHVRSRVPTSDKAAAALHRFNTTAHTQLHTATQAWNVTLETLQHVLLRHVDPVMALSSAGMQPQLSPQKSTVAATSCYTDGIAVMAHIARDWVARSAPQYADILSQMAAYYRMKINSTGKPTVLIPGSGAGRLAELLVRKGFRVEAVDCSWPMILATANMLRLHRSRTRVRLHPYLMVQSNLWQTKDALKSFLVPPRSALPTAHVLDISLIHADVFQVCRSRKFELIATAWFLDTQPNILAAVDKFFACLKPGGHWVNVGPLKYHGGETATPRLAAQELLDFMGVAGFEVRQAKLLQQQLPYIPGIPSMELHYYRPLMFVAQKPGKI